MSTQKRWMVSACIGLALSGTGLALVLIGGYGPCGPGGLTSTIGSVLGFWHFVGLTILIPPLGEWLATGLKPQWLSVALNYTLIVLVPTATWSLLIFSFWTLCRRFSAHGTISAEPGAPPTGGPAKQFGNSQVGGGPPSVS